MHNKPNELKRFFISVSRNGAAVAHLHELVQWKRAGTEEESSSWLFRPLDSTQSLIKSNIWQLGCAAHRLYCIIHFQHQQPLQQPLKNVPESLSRAER